MPHRRPSRSRTRSHATARWALTTGGTSAVAAAVRSVGYGVEGLEVRRLLTTFTAAAGAVGRFNYEQLDGAPIALIYSDVTFEAIANVGDTPANLVPVEIPQPVGANLFKIYVTDSHPDSFIAITAYNPTTGHLLPYVGSATSFGSISTTNIVPYTVVAPAGTGAVTLGGTTAVGTNANGIPAIPLTSSFGLQPAPEDGLLASGIEVATVSPLTDQPNNFGNFLVAGTVTGQVYFGGNVNEFYAGAVLTGVLTGGSRTLVSDETAALAPVVPTTNPSATTPSTTTPAPRYANFSVAGDLREFTTDGPVGTDGLGTAQLPTYVTDFAMTVGGTLGEMHVGSVGEGAGAAWAGTLQVFHEADIAAGVASATTPATFYDPGDFQDQSEVETVVSKANLVAEGVVTGTVGIGTGAYVGGEFGFGEVDLSNDTAAGAQILGSIPVLGGTTALPTADANGNLNYDAVVVGELEGTVPNVRTDTVDYYAMAFQAGQTFTVNVNGGPFLSVLDPDMRVIASNAEGATNTLQITADRPGLYYFDVNEGSSTGDLPYVLTVTGTGDLGIGGIAVFNAAATPTAGGFYDDDGYDSGIVADRGDLGAIVVSGGYVSRTTGPTPSADASLPVHAATSIGVDAGSLRALVAEQIGIATAADALVLADGPTLNVPFGGVGLVRSTAGVLDLETQFDPNYLDGLGQTKTDDASAAAIGGAVQVIDAATKFQTDLATNAGVGTIRAGDMATDQPSIFDVNADNVGNDGIIDLIDVSGNFGTFPDGGPEFFTNDGGDVRYLHVTGTVFRDAFFGNPDDPADTGLFGAAQTFQDQAGNTVTVSPVGPVTFADTTTTTTTATGGSSSSGTGSGASAGGSGSGVTGTAGTSGSTPVTTGTGQSQTTSTGTPIAGPTITMLLYPVRDKGGSIPISIASTGGLEISAADTAGNNGELDVATVSIAGTGQAIVATGATDQFGNPVLAQETATGTLTAATTGSVNTTGTAVNGTTAFAGNRLTAADLIPRGGVATVGATNEFLLLTGPTTVNVLDVDVTSGTPTAIVNTTKGEIASLVAPAVGTIQTVGNLGFTTPEATPAVDLPRAVIANGNPGTTVNGTTTYDPNEYPFVGQHTGVVIGTGIVYNPALPGYQGGTGDAISILVGGGVANVQVGGTLQTLVANSGGKAPPGQVDGIDGPIVAGRILNTDVGQGISFRGTGVVGGGGLYATDVIGAVTNTGNPGANIRGNILSGEQTTAGETTAVTQAINEVNLVNGSLIDAQIINVADANFVEASELTPTGLLLPVRQQSPQAVPYLYDIGVVGVSGAGGIIGTSIIATNINDVVVGGGGFGILNSEVGSQQLGIINEVLASGYGIRDSTIGRGGYVGTVNANGNGAVVPTSVYPIAVRESDNGDMTIDPSTGMLPTARTDINAALGVTGASAAEADVTDTGVIEDDTISGLVNLGSLTAHRIRTALPEVTTEVLPLPSRVNTPVVGTTFANSIAFGGFVGRIRVFDTIDGLQVTAGHLARMVVDGNISRLGISVAGPIDSVVVHGNVGQTITDPATGDLEPDSYIQANGPAGRITSLTVDGGLFANVLATGRIGTLAVNGDVYGSITAQGNVTGTNPRNVAAYSVNTLRVTGTIRNGGLNITGNVNRLIVSGSLGTATDALSINGAVNQIMVGAARKPGAQLALALTVTGTVQKLNVYGQITGAVHVLGDVRSLVVTGSGPADAITAPVTVGGRLYNATVTGGNVAADVTVGGDLYKFTVVRGTIAAGATIESTLASIHLVQVLGGSAYGIAGSVVAPSGTGLAVATTGSFGNGATPSTISALSAGRISIGGSVEADATVSIVAQLDSLFVGGGIQAGGAVIGHPIRSHTVRGTTAGTLTVS